MAAKSASSSSTTHASASKLPRAEAKLLRRLVDAGASGVASGDGPNADRLRRRGLAALHGDRLVATALGRSRLERDAAGDHGFIAQHRTLARRTMATGDAHETVLVDLDESPLAWLARRKGRDGKPLLAAAEVSAGERLRADFTRAQMTPRVTANWEASVASGRRSGAGHGLDVSDAALAAKQRVARALDAVGPELSGALLDVCCFLKGLEEVERERGWPARGAKLVLGLALSRLAAHYGLSEHASGAGGGRLFSWRAPGSRPTIDGAEPS